MLILTEVHGNTVISDRMHDDIVGRFVTPTGQLIASYAVDLADGALFGLALSLLMLLSSATAVGLALLFSHTP